MNLEAFQKGVYSLVVSVGMTFSQVLIPSPPPPVSPSLQNPGTIESFNVVSDNYNLELPLSPEEATSEADTEQTESSATLPEQPVEATTEAIVTVEVPPKPKKVAKASVSPSPASEVKAEEAPKKEEVKKEAKTEEKKTEAITPKTVVGTLTGAAEKLFQMANEHRTKVGLAPFEKEERICKIAEGRAPQVYDEVFKDGPMHKGFKALALPYWATENIAAYDSIEKNFSFWLRDGIHRQALEGPSKYSCVACSGSYCSQIFTSFIPK